MDWQALYLVLLSLLLIGWLFCIFKYFTNLIKFHRMPKATLKVDGHEFEFKVASQKKNGNVYFFGQYDKDSDLRFSLTSDPDRIGLLAETAEGSGAKTPASLEFLGEHISFKMLKMDAEFIEPSLNLTAKVNYYLGVFIHEFPNIGTLACATDLITYSWLGGPKKRRRRRMLRKIEMPKWELPSLFPQGAPI